MATFDYAEIVEEADTLLQEFGFKAQIRRGDALRDCTLLRWDYRPQERDGQMIQFTDRRYLVSAHGLDPAPDPEEDKLVIGSDEMRVVTSVPLQPAETPIFYEVQARL